MREGVGVRDGRSEAMLPHEELCSVNILDGTQV